VQDVDGENERENERMRGGLDVLSEKERERESERANMNEVIRELGHARKREQEGKWMQLE